MRTAPIESLNPSETSTRFTLQPFSLSAEAISRGINRESLGLALKISVAWLVTFVTLFVISALERAALVKVHGPGGPSDIASRKRRASNLIRAVEKLCALANYARTTCRVSSGRNVVSWGSVGFSRCAMVVTWASLRCTDRKRCMLLDGKL